MRLKALLALHDQHAPRGALRRSFGDGYLLEHNRVYRNLRAFCLRGGYRYTTRDYCHYRVHPLAALDAILRARRIPYLDNVSVLRRIERCRSGGFDFADILPSQPNYLLHESAHCAADALLRRVRLPRRALGREQELAFRMILAEAFANTVETFGNIAGRGVAHATFYAMGSHLAYSGGELVALRTLTRAVGPEAAFRLVLLAYLYSNCLYKRIPAPELTAILTTLVPDEARRRRVARSRSLAAVLAQAFRLQLEFRLKTASFHFAMRGIRSRLFAVLDIELLPLVRHEALRPFFYEAFRVVAVDARAGRP